jgi:peptidoglycan-associated lipoprotein
MMTAAGAWGQQKAMEEKATWKLSSIDMAVTFAPERAQQVGSGSAFWFEGGGVDAAAMYKNGLGIGVALNGERSSNVAPGVDLNKITFLAGPRWAVWSGHAGQGKQAKPLHLFAEGLVGSAHAFNSMFPSPNQAATSANALAVQAGGGLNLELSPHYGLRLAQIDYVRTAFANNGSGSQNDLRLAFGFTVRIGR